MSHISLVFLFQDSLFFYSLTMICLDFDIFAFIIFGIYWVFWMCRLFYIKFGKFLTIICSNIPPASFSVSFPTGAAIIFILVKLILSYRSLRFCLLLFFFILSSSLFFRLDNLNLFIFKSTDSSLILFLFLLSAQIWHWAFLVEFSLVIVLFNSRIKLWFIFYNFYFFINIIYLRKHLSHTFL